MSKLYAEIERLTRENAELLKATGVIEAGLLHEIERLTREIERLRAALEQMYSAHRSIGFHSRKMKWTHCDECDAYREALGEPKP